MNITPPFPEKIQLAVFCTVKKIAGNDESFGVKKLHLVQQPLHICTENLLRHGNTRFPEMPCFSKMAVAYNQALGFFPENNPMPRQP